MTVTYTHEVANTRLGGFSRLLGRWKGSVYKLFYKEFLIYISLYALVSIVYRLILDRRQRNYFEKLCLQFEHYTDLVPISFVLGFYVSIIIGRWWSQFENIPWPDRLMMIIGSNVHGSDERGRLLRRTLIRYLNLTQVLVYRCVSTAVFKRFPSMDHVVVAGVMTKQEHQLYDNVTSKNLKYWVPMLWFNNLLSKARQEGRIYDDITYNLLIKESNRFRGNCGQLVNYDWISVPLVYTQVVTVAVYLFFCSTLLSRQYLDTERHYEGHGVDLVVPIFTIGQFFFYVGWLKVAEQLINPFGEDDEDFEANWCIDRNLEVSLLAVDSLYARHPKLEKDEFWNKDYPDLPYTAAAVNHKIDPFMGSTYDMRLTKSEQGLTSGFIPQAQNGMDDGENRIKETHLELPDNTLRTKSFGNLLSFSEKVRESIAMMSNSKRLSVSESSLLNDSTSSESSGSEDSHDEQISDEEDKSALSELATINGADSANEKKHFVLQDPNNNKLLPDVSSDEEGKMDPVRGELEENKAEKSQGEITKQLPRLPKDHNRPKQLNLNIQFSSRSTYPIPSSIRLHCNDEKFEDRKNAEKRVHLYERRRRKNKMGCPPRKRTRRSINYPNNWPKKRNNLKEMLSQSESPGVLSAWSESDIASGPAGDSPMGSLISCSTSIPSPKQLRWAFRSAAPNIYGDTTSIASSVTSPSGTEGADNETPFFTLGSSMLSYAAPHKLPVDSRDVTQLLLKRSNSNASSGKEDRITPYTDDLRKRLQVVASHSPTPSSPLKISNSHYQDVLTSSTQPGKTWKILKADKLIPNGIPKEKTPRKLTGHSLNVSKFHNKHSISLLEKHAKKTDQLSKIPALSSNTLSFEESKPIRRNSSGIWKAFKTWNTKRKETKEREKSLLPMKIANDKSPHRLSLANVSSNPATTFSKQSGSGGSIVNDFNLVEELSSTKSLCDASSETLVKKLNSDEIELGLRAMSQELAITDVTPPTSKCDSLQWESEENAGPTYMEKTSALNPNSLSLSLKDDHASPNQGLKMKDHHDSIHITPTTTQNKLVPSHEDNNTASVIHSNQLLCKINVLDEEENDHNDSEEISLLCDCSTDSVKLLNCSLSHECTSALESNFEHLVNLSHVPKKSSLSNDETAQNFPVDAELKMTTCSDSKVKRSVSFDEQNNFGLEVIPEISCEKEKQITVMTNKSEEI